MNALYYQQHSTGMQDNQLPYGKDYQNSSIILPPPHNAPKVLLPPPSAIWDYRYSNSNNNNSNNSTSNNNTGNMNSNNSNVNFNNNVNSSTMSGMNNAAALMQLSYKTNGGVSTHPGTNTPLTVSTAASSPSPIISLAEQFSSHPILPSISNSLKSPLSSPPSLSSRNSSTCSTSVGDDYHSHSHHHAHQQPYSSSSSSAIHKSKSKPRSKKQCPECHLFFSNLSTHKSIHLNPENRPYLCDVCGRGFSRSNDLLRHNKRHWKETGLDEGAFKCPFSSILMKKQLGEDDFTSNNNNIHNSNSFDDIPCHPTGIFSRCDTYKNHLKALHFDYPPGTKKKNRNGVQGSCKKCGKVFKDVNEWLDMHVETGECGMKFD